MELRVFRGGAEAPAIPPRRVVFEVNGARLQLRAWTEAEWRLIPRAMRPEARGLGPGLYVAVEPLTPPD
jgi:hypothetical protein